MERRKFLKAAAALPVLGLLPACDDDNEYYRHYEISPSVPETSIESDLMGVNIKLALFKDEMVLKTTTTQLKYGESFYISYKVANNNPKYIVEFPDGLPLIGMGRVYTSAGEYVGIADDCPNGEFATFNRLETNEFVGDNYQWSVANHDATNPYLERGDYYIQNVFEYKMYRKWKANPDYIFKIFCKINFTVE